MELDLTKTRKVKVPKTWSDFRITNPITAHIVDKEYYCCSIEKTARALVKIYLLIKYGYGGNITDEEWKDSDKLKHVIIPEGNILKKDFYLWTRTHLAFHTMEQRNEFMSYPENIQLIKDFYMI